MLHLTSEVSRSGREETATLRLHTVKYLNLLRTKKSIFSRVRTITRIKKIITKMVCTKLGSTKTVFIDRRTSIFVDVMKDRTQMT